MAELQYADLAMKTLGGRDPAAVLRLVGINAAPCRISSGDTSVVAPEFRVDQVLICGKPGEADYCVIQLEYQLTPDLRRIKGWFFKNAVLTIKYGVPVILVTIYLEKGKYTEFPDRYQAEAHGLSNLFRFETVRLWEHAHRIRSGELGVLAPLLCLCEDNPTVETLIEERTLISQQAVAEEDRQQLFAIATMIGRRSFPVEILQAVFPGEIEMTLREMPFIQEWVEIRALESKAEGKAEEARRFLTLILENRFGSLSAAVMEIVDAGDIQWCEDLAARAMAARSLAELGL